MSRKFALFTILLLIMFPLADAYAANWYVSKGASGSNDGADWTNAWNEMNQIVWGGSGVNAGDTVWLAAGSYATMLTPNASGTSGNRIYIRAVLATDSVPTSAPGWQSSYAVQASPLQQVSMYVSGGNVPIAWISGTSGTGSYVTLDGRIPHGIYAYNDGSTTWAASLSMNTGNEGVVIQYCEFVGYCSTIGGNCTYPGGSSGTLVYVVGRTDLGYGTPDYIDINHCILRGAPTLLELSATNVTLEYNIWSDDMVTNSSTYHPTLIGGVDGCTSAGPCIFRYNTVYNWAAEGIMAYSATTPATWYVYGNLFHDAFNYPGEETARAWEPQYNAHTLYLYNNTFVNCYESTGATGTNGGSYGSASQSRNNISWNVNGPVATIDDDYNFSNAAGVRGSHSISSASNPFVNYSRQNYQIIGTPGATYPLGKGEALSALSQANLYSTDIVGNAYANPASMGAYEFIVTGLMLPARVWMITGQ